jgi:hypothetical protein
MPAGELEERSPPSSGGVRSAPGRSATDHPHDALICAAVPSVSRLPGLPVPSVPLPSVSLPNVPLPKVALTPLKTAGGTADAVVGGAIVKALVVTDLAYCVLVREPLWQLSGIRLP